MSNRKNKNKKEIVSDIQLAADAERRRALVRDIVFPYLLQMNDSISYSKIFLQTFSTLVDGIYEAGKKKTTIGQIGEETKEKIKSIFKLSDEKQKIEYERYIGFVDKLKDISIQDLAYALEMGRYIDGYLLAEEGKKSITNIDVNKLLG